MNVNQTQTLPSASSAAPSSSSLPRDVHNGVCGREVVTGIKTDAAELTGISSRLDDAKTKSYRVMSVSRQAHVPISERPVVTPSTAAATATATEASAASAQSPVHYSGSPVAERSAADRIDISAPEDLAIKSNCSGIVHVADDNAVLLEDSDRALWERRPKLLEYGNPKVTAAPLTDAVAAAVGARGIIDRAPRVNRQHAVGDDKQEAQNESSLKPYERPVSLQYYGGAPAAVSAVLHEFHTGRASWKASDRGTFGQRGCLSRVAVVSRSEVLEHDDDGDGDAEVLYEKALSVDSAGGEDADAGEVRRSQSEPDMHDGDGDTSGQCLVEAPRDGESAAPEKTNQQSADTPPPAAASDALMLLLREIVMSNHDIVKVISSLYDHV